MEATNDADSIARPSVSLFSNCGAGDFGYRTAGFNFLVLAELVAKRLRVAALNHPGATNRARRPEDDLANRRRTVPQLFRRAGTLVAISMSSLSRHEFRE